MDLKMIDGKLSKIKNDIYKTNVVINNSNKFIREFKEVIKEAKELNNAKK